MRRIKAVVTCVVAAVVMTPGPVAAQDAGPSLEIATWFDHPDREVSYRPLVFAFDEPIHAYLDLTNTGSEPVTGVSATLSFVRGDVEVESVRFPDVPAGENVGNSDPFVFRYGQRQVQDDDPWSWSYCFIDFSADPPDEAVVDRAGPGVDDVVWDDDPYYSSDDFKPIAPGRLIFTVTTDQGKVDYTHEWEAECYWVLASHGVYPGAPDVVRGADSDVEGRRRLAATGSRQVVAVAGVLSILGGIAMRVVAGTMATRPERRWDAP